MSAQPTTVLITGANRGIGKSFVAWYLSQDNHTVIAATRNPAHATSKELLDLPKGTGSNIVLVKIDSASDADAKLAVAELESSHGITVFDTVIANAGINNVMPYVKDTKASDMIEHFQVNVLAVIALFQAVLPGLEKSKDPKFVTITSMAGSLEYSPNLSFPNTPYGTSKVALNYITRRIHVEHENIVAFTIHPGLVKTEMGERGAQELGLEAMWDESGVTADETVAGMVPIIGKATRGTTSGQFMSYDGTVAPW